MQNKQQAVECQQLEHTVRKHLSTLAPCEVDVFSVFYVSLGPYTHGVRPSPNPAHHSNPPLPTTITLTRSTQMLRRPVAPLPQA